MITDFLDGEIDFLHELLGKACVVLAGHDDTWCVTSLDNGLDLTCHDIVVFCLHGESKDSNSIRIHAIHVHPCPSVHIHIHWLHTLRAHIHRYPKHQHFHIVSHFWALKSLKAEFHTSRVISTISSFEHLNSDLMLFDIISHVFCISIYYPEPPFWVPNGFIGSVTMQILNSFNPSSPAKISWPGAKPHDL